MTSTHSRPPISRLPVELLSEVFCYMPVDVVMLDTRRRNTFPSWFAVTHVCRHWRRVAYACPGLWLFMPLESLEWTNVALEKSKPGPIIILADTIDFLFGKSEDYHDWILPEALEVAFGSVYRAVEIEWSAKCETEDEQAMLVRLLAVLLRSAAPLLESLNIWFEVYEDIQTLDIPDGLFLNCPLPQLQTLDISGSIALGESQLFRSSSLTSLRMYEVDVRRIWPTTGDMISSLRDLPRLETLELNRCFSSIDPSAPAIVLPCLTRLILLGDFAPVSQSMHLISSPILRTLDVTIRLKHEAAPSVQEKVETLQALFMSRFSAAHSARNSYRSCQIQTSDPYLLLDVQIQAEDPQVAGPHLPTRLLLTLSVEVADDVDRGLGDDPEWDIAKEFSPVAFKALPLSGVRTLAVSHDHEGDNFDWDTILEQWVEVENLIVSTSAAHSLLASMHQAWLLRSHSLLESNLTSAPPTLPLPALAHLTIEQLDFIANAEEYKPSSFALMQGVLEGRADGDFPPFKLVLRGCTLTPDMLSSLSRSISDDMFEHGTCEVREHKFVDWDDSLSSDSHTSSAMSDSD
ncbi:hypothetical protein BV25DRAFT_1417169 [Artomyces pyxidatus]|uniref:Uncharacterized protein n=1 Tax=Artomyces pyxidatus TaxID=48021 RepID=A0ACB8TE38_9AGAM|nr:hypothetical protein BV25DRAFT_1417169 [Artomyces pyxidatus]